MHFPGTHVIVIPKSEREKWFICNATLSGNTSNTKEHKDENRKQEKFTVQEGRLSKGEDEAAKSRAKTKRYFWEESFLPKLLTEGIDLDGCRLAVALTSSQLV